MSESKAAVDVDDGAVYRLLELAVDVRPAEMQHSVGLGCISSACFLPLLSFASHPRRDGRCRGRRKPPWLFTGTLVGMILVNPPFAALVAKLPRVRFIAIT